MNDRGNKLLLTFSIFMARLALFFCRLTRSGGTNVPGTVALFFCPDIFTRLAADKDIIAVTGTNGKTTTTAMIRHIFSVRGISVISNREGANLDSGLVSTFLKHCDLKGSSSEKTAVLECDEKWVPLVFQKVRPKVLVITNLAEDQLDRTGGPEVIYQSLLSYAKTIPVDLCINKNCPVSSRFRDEDLNNRILSFSADGSGVSVDGAPYPVCLPVSGNNNTENAAAAAAACIPFGIPAEVSLDALKDFHAPFGRMETFSLDGVSVTICLSKNAVSTNGLLNYIEATKADSQVIMCFNANRGDGADRTWIQKIGFLPEMTCLNDVIIGGACAEDLAHALRRAGHSCHYAKNTESVVSLIRASSKPVFLIVNPSYLLKIRKAFAKKGYLKDFWKL